MQNQIEKTSADQTNVPNGIVVKENEVVKFDPTKDIEQGQQAAKALLKLIKLTKPLKLGGKDYLYFEHWITIARFFNATVGIEWTKQTETGWEAKAIVHQNGQVIGSAEASCNRDEANWKSKPDFQIKSMSQTRACSKALRQIFGYIPVLAHIEGTPAEEMDNVSTPAPKPSYAPNIASNKPVEPMPIPKTSEDIQINLLDTTFEKYLTQINEAKNMKELKGYWENVKYLGHTVTPGQKALIRSAIRAKQNELEKK